MTGHQQNKTMQEPYKTILIAIALTLVLVSLYFLFIRKSRYRFLIYGSLAFIALSWIAALFFSVVVTIVTAFMMIIIVWLIVKGWRKNLK